VYEGESEESCQPADQEAQLDGSAGGKASPNGTSMHFLIKWLLTPGNYARWRGDKDHQGRKKKETAKEIAAYINDGGVMEERTGVQVQAQMSRLESNMRAAYDFACTETGAGLLETDKISFDEAVRKKCSYYFELQPVMCERASITPKATSDEPMDSSEEESEDLEPILEVACGAISGMGCV